MRPQQIGRLLLLWLLAPTSMAACYQVAGYDDFSFELPLGSPCASADACASGFCADGVCCNSACDQLCQACGSGVCTAAAAGTDPDDDCAADAADCKQAHCNGQVGDNACNVPTGTSCAAAACISTPQGDEEITEASCGMSGSCPSETNSCGQYRCGGQSCNDNCSEASQCIAGSVCTEQFRCQPLAQQVSAGDLHTCVLSMSGTVKCWGHNAHGQLGNGISGENSNTPLPVFEQNTESNANEELKEVTAISSGDSHSCALLGDDTVRCWGLGSSGQLGNGSTLSRNMPISIAGLVDVQQIASGRSHTCALMLNGTVRCWGSNAQGQLGSGNFTEQLAPGDAVQNLMNVIAIASGQSFSCAVMSGNPNQNSGSVHCWGNNEWGQLGDGTTIGSNVPVQVMGLNDVMRLSCGNEHSCAVRTDGTVWCWGRNQYGQLGDGTGDGSDDHNTAAPIQVLNAAGIEHLSLGANHSCAVSDAGAALCWGRNNHSQLGSALPMDLSNVPISINANANSISAGGSHTCMLLNSGASLCWGNNAFGQLGSGDNIAHPTPTEVVY